MHPLLTKVPISLTGRQGLYPLVGGGEGLANGDQSWIPGVGAQLTSQTCAVLTWGPTGVGHHSL